jgi:glucosamine-6-phosphate deaminase
MNLFCFDSERSWVDGVVRFWRDRMRVNPKLRICLASGQTPLQVYDAMSRAVANGEVTFRESEIFTLDEYGGLARNDPGRCENMVRHYLVDHVDLPPQKFFTINTEAEDLDRVCREYDASIGEGFDLAILGIGLNGHLGLNEPGSSPESLTRRVELHPSTVNASAKYLAHRNLPSWGIGVGLKSLLNSKEVWLLANGRSKCEIIQRTVKGKISTEAPASLLRAHGNCFVFVDDRAGALIRP